MIAQLKDKKFFAYDTETTGLEPLQDALVGISFAYGTQRGYYVPFGHVTDEGALQPGQLDVDYVLEKLKPIFEDAAIHKTVHNAKFDQLTLWHAGIHVQGVVFDSVIAAHLVRKGRQKIGLKMLSQQYLNEPMVQFSDVLGKKREHFGQVPVVEAARYSGHDALQTFKLKLVLEAELATEPTLQKLFEEVEMPLSHVLLKMERHGIELDQETLKEVSERVGRKLQSIEQKILATIGTPDFLEGEQINLNSPKQLEVLFFDELQLPVIKLSAEGRRSTERLHRSLGWQDERFLVGTLQ